VLPLGCCWTPHFLLLVLVLHTIASICRILHLAPLGCQQNTERTMIEEGDAATRRAACFERGCTLNACSSMRRAAPRRPDMDEDFRLYDGARQKKQPPPAQDYSTSKTKNALTIQKVSCIPAYYGYCKGPRLKTILLKSRTARVVS
jgi:hypothetical protein